MGTQLAEPVTPLADAQIELGKLKAFGSRDYHRYTPTGLGNERYTRTPCLTLEVTEDAQGFRLYDRLIIEFGSKVLTDICMIRSCTADNFLSLRGLNTDSDGDVRHHTVADGKVSAEIDGKTYSEPLPSQTLSAAAFARIATILPQSEGRAWSVPHFISGLMSYSVRVASATAASEIDAKNPYRRPAHVENATIRCQGAEKVATTGAVVDCTKFVVESDGRILATAWVTPDGVLHQFQDGGGSIYALAAIRPVPGASALDAAR